LTTLRTRGREKREGLMSGKRIVKKKKPPPPTVGSKKKEKSKGKGNQVRG